MRTTYDVDFYQWTQEQARLIRQGRWSELDAAHAADELEDMGKRDRREVLSRMTLLMMHLLKCRYQPEQVERSTWIPAINEQRLQLDLVLKDSPSLKRFADEILPRVYQRARRDAAVETKLRLSTFPKACPYTSVEQILK